MPSPDRVHSMIDAQMFEKYSADRSKRWYFEDNFKQRPLLEAEGDPAAFSQAAQRLLTAGNADFKVAGTNMTTALSTFDPDGGILLTTAGAAADQALIIPRTVNSLGTYTTSIGGGVGAVGAASAPWVTNKSIAFDCTIELASVAGIRVYAGFKKAANLTLTTDTDQCLIQFDTGLTASPTLWHSITSVSNVDTDRVLTGGAAIAVAAATTYRLKIRVGADRIPTYYINGQLGGVGPAMTTGIALWPFIGIHAIAAAAKSIKIRNIRCSRLLN